MNMAKKFPEHLNVSLKELYIIYGMIYVQNVYSKCLSRACPVLKLVGNIQFEKGQLVSTVCILGLMFI